MANWYVRPTSSGSNNGTNWTNAWSASSLAWGSVHAGDTVWLAGGSYGGLSANTNGANGNPVVLKRATANDAAATGATGWSSAFDSLVTFTSLVYLGSCNYLTLDGNVTYGILVLVPDGGNGIELGVNGCTGVSLLNLEVRGPGFRAVTLETLGINASHGGNPVIANLRIAYCLIQGVDGGIKADNFQNSVIEHCTIQNISSSNLGALHPDSIYFYPCVNTTIRYCLIQNVDAESLFFDFGGSTGMVFHNNLMVQGSGQSSSAIEVKGGYTMGTIFVHNNTFVGWTKGLLYQGAAATGSLVENNLFYNSPCNNQGAVADYNGFFGVSSSGTHVTVGSSDPFVNRAAGDYHLKSGSWAIGAGTNLGANYATDYDGNNRASSGAWDLGAFAFTTAPVGPNPPTAVNVTGATGNSLRLSWTPSTSSGVAGYRVNYGTQSGSYTASLAVGAVANATVTGLSSATTYYLAVQARDGSNNYGSNSAPELQASTSVAAGTYTLFGNATPGTANSGDTQAVNVGVNFYATQAGTVTGIRFYKGSANTGTHVGTLYDGTSHAVLAQVTFSGENASGWQQMNFATPYAASVNHPYTLAVYCPAGNYSDDSGYFNTDRLATPLVAPSSPANGVYLYGTSSGYPTQTFQSTNYWVDVAFTVSGPAPTAPQNLRITAHS